MGILNRIRRNLETLAPGKTPAVPEQLSFSAEIPGAEPGAPLWRVKLQLVSEPHGDGEKLRLRAHVQTNFASALKPALAAPRKRTADAGTALTLAERGGAMAQRALTSPLLQKLAAPLLKHDFNTWIEMQASTASLDEGAQALLPQSEQLTAMGIVPSRQAGGPLAESWTGGTAHSHAQVSILQLDKRHLPPRLAALLEGKPFQMAAAIVNTIEEK